MVTFLLLFQSNLERPSNWILPLVGLSPGVDLNELQEHLFQSLKTIKEQLSIALFLTGINKADDLSNLNKML